ncbi:hypothetical protein CO054_00520 [Candidatus Shapirobacteria bacterium CG_4_9_14_0_2_um_filter_39_11]|uniref:Antitoxin SocA-like Panacea domain-containing protein n=1 Tax=Candidatus Shapirobacteria bacterium CG_4_9_14_0_2_um_filter_39_11 TaxID=1974478 RepID=A0A2M8ETD7_9BACT|nr:MAG: hypothetical protein CO054_00520 [Candidatus Shapirobacteria bacterium CG_4_9_14_0_2_um_filter_39_11]
MRPVIKKLLNISASDVAKYYLYRSTRDGELISPLKMQKLIYYAYVWTLLKNHQKLFGEKIEAWSLGPVVPSLYRELKRYGSAPIDEDFIGSGKEIKEIESKFPPNVRKTIDEVYEEYMTKTAFELVQLVHEEKPWVNARKGLSPGKPSGKPIKDDDIIRAYSMA